MASRPEQPNGGGTANHTSTVDVVDDSHRNDSCKPSQPTPKTSSGVDTNCGARLKKCTEQLTNAMEGLLIPDERRVNEEELFTEDLLKITRIRTLAKIASRDIKILCIPVSTIARNMLEKELLAIKNSTHQQAAWHGKTKWWLSDKSNTISGEERAQRVVSAVIRDETKTHAHDSTDRKKVRKDQQQHDHSIFRQFAEGFVPPPATPKAIKSNKSNHPRAGESRKVGVTVTRQRLHDAGFHTYDSSKSGAARDKLATGRREVHGIKDLQHANPNGKFVPGMVHTFVDQDMYIDDLSAYAGENMLVITPEYNKLAGYGTDSVWYYNMVPDLVNGSYEVVVTERVATDNGATYKNQRPWNYTENDFIYLEHAGNSAFTTYNVDIQYQAGSHHKWVWLARNSTTSLSKSVCDMMLMAVGGTPLDGTPLKKADNVVIVQGDTKTYQDTFLMGMFGDTNCPMHSIKYACDKGPDTSMELTENQYRLFNLMGKNRPKGYGVSEVERVLKKKTIWRSDGLEPLLVAFFGIPVEFRPRPNIMYTRQDGSTDDEVVEDAPAVQGAPNIAGDGPGVADTKSKAAKDAYKTKRLEAYRNTTDPPEAFKEVLGMLLEHFINQVADETTIDRNSLVMPGREFIYLSRAQALQAARLKRHNELLAKLPGPKTSLKAEVGPKASPAPRATTQYNEEMAIQTGRVGLLLKGLLKHCEHYMPGSSPSDISSKLREVAAMALEASDPEDTTSPEVAKRGRVSGMHDTDYSKMDETISQYIYEEVFVKFTMAFVHPSEKDEVKTILAENVDFTTMLDAQALETGFKNNSGSGVTTELNTIVSAFIEYTSTCFAVTQYIHRSRHDTELDLSAVKKNTIRSALKHYKAHHDVTHLMWGDFMLKGNKINIFSIPYSVIGPKFGDDGVGAHLPCISDDEWRAASNFVTTTIGMLLKVSFSRPEEGTFFLGRFYPKPLESPASYADVAKSCRKISVARNCDLEKYKFKLHGYWTTDSKTPGISQYLTAVARMYGVDLHAFDGVTELDDDGRPVLTQEMAHLLANDRDMFYRVVGGPYCVDAEDEPMMLEAVAPQIGFHSSGELEDWLARLAECTTWEQLDEFQFPGADYDPDAEPENTRRMSGPVASLLEGMIDNIDRFVSVAEHANELLAKHGMETPSTPELLTLDSNIEQMQQGTKRLDPSSSSNSSGKSSPASPQRSE